jgi:hypothetical protein
MSCLFDSIGKGIQTPGVVVRDVVCGYLNRDGRLFDDATAKDIVDSQYTQRMRNPNTWGGGIEIRAACEALNLIITVRGPPLRNPITFYPLKPVLGTRRISLYYTGSHYTWEPRLVAS